LNRWKGQFQKIVQVKEIPFTHSIAKGVIIEGYSFQDTLSEKPTFYDVPILLIGAMIPQRNGGFYIKTAGPKYALEKEVSSFQYLLNQLQNQKAFQSHSKIPSSSSMTLDFEGFSLKVPQEWTLEKPSHSTRLYQLGSSKTKLKINFYYFGKPPSEIPLFQTNLVRWLDQFIKVEGQRELAFAIQKRHPDIRGVAIWGVYKKRPFPNSQEIIPLPHYMMVSVLIPSPKGPYFIRILGPKEKVEQEIPILKKLVNSYQKK
ncbi:MAG: hypothetical protein D6785_01975, partial [Planctomycetota bacterium]